MWDLGHCSCNCVLLIYKGKFAHCSKPDIFLTASKQDEEVSTVFLKCFGTYCIAQVVQSLMLEGIMKLQSTDFNTISEIGMFGVFSFCRNFAKLCDAPGFWENVLDSFPRSHTEIAYSNFTFPWYLHAQFSGAPHNFRKNEHTDHNII